MLSVRHISLCGPFFIMCITCVSNGQSHPIYLWVYVCWPRIILFNSVTRMNCVTFHFSLRFVCSESVFSFLFYIKFKLAKFGSVHIWRESSLSGKMRCRVSNRSIFDFHLIPDANANEIEWQTMPFPNINIKQGSILELCLNLKPFCWGSWPFQLCSLWQCLAEIVQLCHISAVHSVHT